MNEEIKVVETEKEQLGLLYDVFSQLDQRLRRKDAEAYVGALRDAKAKHDFKKMQDVWNGLGSNRFGKKDYIEVVKPLIDSDVQIVRTSIEKMQSAKNANHLRSLARLSEPVVPPAYHLWKVERDKIALSLRPVNKTFHKEGNIISNSISSK